MVAAPEPRLLTVTPFDKSLAPAIEKAHPRFRPRPQPGQPGRRDPRAAAALNEERRKELVKVVHKLAEEGRVAVRHARSDADEQDQEARASLRGRQARAEKDVQKVTDEHIKQIDELMKAKEAEIMEV